MNSLQIFENEEFGQVRTVMIGEEPWLVGKDVAMALGYKDTINALKSHVDEDDKRGWQITTQKGVRETTIINESGMYSLIFGSKLESAKRFKHWVTSEVLPAIRKSGKYGQNVYRIQDAPLSEVIALMHEASSFLREMDKVMREQNSHPSDIAEEFKSVCNQLGIVKLSDNFVKESYAPSSSIQFLTLEEVMAVED